MPFLYSLTFTAALKMGILVPFHKGRKQVRLERLGRWPKVIQPAKTQMGSSRAPAGRLTVKNEERVSLGPEPGARWNHWAVPGYLYDTSPALSRLLALAATVSLPIPGRKKPGAASGTSYWRISLECRVETFYFKLQVE